MKNEFTLTEAIDQINIHLFELNDPGFELEICYISAIRFNVGWVFMYNTKEYNCSGDPIKSVVGNAPLIFNKKTGEIITTGTSESSEYYVDQYLVKLGLRAGVINTPK